MPEAFIIKRWDAELNGLTQEWRNAYYTLSEDERKHADLIIDTNNFNKGDWINESPKVRFLLDFYLEEREEIPLADEDKKIKAIKNFELTCPREPSDECRKLLNACLK